MSGKILIVDSVATNRIVLNVKLSAAFYTVFQAASAREALDLAKDHRPDMVVCAASLPDMGFALFARRLRALPDLQALPLVALLDRNAPETRLAMLGDGATDIVAKPFSEPVFLARLRSLLRQTHRDSELGIRADAAEAQATDAIAREDYSPAQRIARMLSYYVQKLSKEHPPIRPLQLDSEAQAHNWRYTEFRKHCRQDMERAVQSLGRINPKNEAVREAFMPRNIDLSYCNLQGFDLRNRQYQGARFRHSNLQAADLEGAHLEYSDLTVTDLRDADMRKAHLQGAILFQARMSTLTQIVDCNFRGAAIFFVDEETITKLRPYWNDIIAFMEWLPPDAPSHWHEVNNFEPDQAESDWRTWAAEHHPGIKIYSDHRDKHLT